MGRPGSRGTDWRDEDSLCARRVDCYCLTVILYVWLGWAMKTLFSINIGLPVVPQWAFLLSDTPTRSVISPLLAYRAKTAYVYRASECR